MTQRKRKSPLISAAWEFLRQPIDGATYLLIALGLVATGWTLGLEMKLPELATLLTAIFSAVAAAFSALAAHRAHSLTKTLDRVTLDVVAEVTADQASSTYLVHVVVTNVSRRPVTVSAVVVRQVGRILGGHVIAVDRFRANADLPKRLESAEPLVTHITIPRCDVALLRERPVHVRLMTGEQFTSAPLHIPYGL